MEIKSGHISFSPTTKSQSCSVKKKQPLEKTSKHLMSTRFIPSLNLKKPFN